MSFLNEAPLTDLTPRGASMPSLSVQISDPRVASGALSLAAALRSCAPLPASALFVGLAADGLPVLLDLRRTDTSPVLVLGDAGAGKTRLLRTLARSIELSHDPDQVRYAAVTLSPSEWSEFGSSPHCEGILSFHHALTTGYMASLVHWTQSGPEGSRPRYLVLLIDDLAALSGDGDLRESRSWLLAAGPSNGIRPVVTLSTSSNPMPGAWLDLFSSRLFGFTRNKQLENGLSGCSVPNPVSPQTDLQFSMREGPSWVPFWLPAID